MKFNYTTNPLLPLVSCPLLFAPSHYLSPLILFNASVLVCTCSFS